MSSNKIKPEAMSVALRFFSSGGSQTKSILHFFKIVAITAPLYVLTGCSAKAVKPRAAIHTLPSFSILLLDTLTRVTSGQMSVGHPIVLMYFDPACEHCQLLTKMIKRNIDSFPDIRIYLLTPSSYEQVKYFCDAYHLDDFKSITVGTDYKYSFYQAFKPSALPYVVIYDGQKKLVKEFAYGADVHEIIKALHF